MGPFYMKTVFVYLQSGKSTSMKLGYFSRFKFYHYHGNQEMKWPSLSAWVNGWKMVFCEINCCINNQIQLNCHYYFHDQRVALKWISTKCLCTVCYSTTLQCLVKVMRKNVGSPSNSNISKLFIHFKGCNIEFKSHLVPTLIVSSIMK